MRLARGLNHLALPSGGCVATIGNFDGVHVGHRVLIENLAKHAQRLRLPLVVVLFEPQPREYFAPQQAPARLTRLREKLLLMAELPVDVVLLLKFDRQLAECAPEDFVQKVMIDALRVRYLVVGDDFRFGKRRQGNTALLRKMSQEGGFEVADTQPVVIAGERVSSTLVREALLAGDMRRARLWLGRAYSICGRIASGEMLGRQIGFPTANIRLLRKNTPLMGVFAVTMTGIAEHPLAGVANVGERPTVSRAHSVLLETHLLDFSGNIYGRLVEVRFHHKLRDEQRFENMQALTGQIQQDVAAARNFFANADPKLLCAEP